MVRLIGKSKQTLKTAGSATFGAKTETDLLALFQNAVVSGAITGVWNLQEVYNEVLANDWIANQTAATARAQTGGSLTLNSVSLGDYDYTYVGGNQTVSSFTSSDFFTATNDSKSALIYIDGNLTINSGEVFIPAGRKLFTAIYVKGNLTVDGRITMVSRGANHSPTGSPRSSANIKLATGTYTGVPDPSIPSSGGGGGSGATATPSPNDPPVNPGSSGSGGGTGGGGGGAATIGGNVYGGSSYSGSGSSGTSFTGGTGGGGAASLTPTPAPNTTAGNASSNGGKGGNACPAPTHYTSGGGGGNPGGSGYNLSGARTHANGRDGTAGVLVIYVEGNYSGSGEVDADGRNNFYTKEQTGYGGSVGGGSVTIFVGGTNTGPTPTAAGGIGQGGPSSENDIPATSYYDNSISPAGFGVGQHGSNRGGSGGAGTARVLSLTAS